MRVFYVGIPAEPNSMTVAAPLSFGDDRPDLAPGTYGDLTEEELHTLRQTGLLINVVGEELNGLSKAELLLFASEAGIYVDQSGSAVKVEREIREALEARSHG